MNSNTTLRTTIAAILRGSALGTLGISTLGVGLAHAADSDADVSDSGAIPEIVVTAERRTESLENVPITIQAISGDELQKLNVQTFEDVLRYTPNVTFAGNGPGQGNIFMRGLSAGGAPNQSQSTTSPFPNVGLYLDDQSMQFPGRNNDPYLVDIERVEVLEGPQGTLFGGGAEAGAIRYLTNKPKIDVTEGNANAGYGYTSGGDPNFMRQCHDQPAAHPGHIGRTRHDLHGSTRRLHFKCPGNDRRRGQSSHWRQCHPDCK